MKAFKTSWKHIRRSPYQALAAIFIMIQTFFVISVFSFVIFGSSKVISYFEATPQVNAFFTDDAKQEDIDSLIGSLKKSGKVSNVTYISKKEAFEKYKELNKDDPLLLDLVSEDILPPSIEVHTTDISDLSTIAGQLKNSPIISQLQFPKDVVEKVIAWSSAIRKIGIGVITVLGLDSMFLMIIIIGIKISQKREEIEIMKLLSATNWYIRWPFVWEGIFYGFVGALIGWGLSIALLSYATPMLQGFFGSIPALSFSPIFLVGLLGAEIIIAMIIGIMSSLLAVLRYLK
jgi:cell division transport system permease protein